MAERVPCWVCGRRGSPDVQACEHCGAMLLTLCEECGATNSVYSTECAECDAAMIPRRYRPRRRWPAVVVLLGILAVAGAAAGALLLDREDSPWQQIEDARVDYEAQRYQAAVVRLRQVVERWPDHSQARYHLALAHAARSQYAEARGHAEMALRLNPDLAGPHLVLAFCAYDERNYLAAREHARRTLLHPGSRLTERLQARAHLLLGKIHTQPKLADLRRAAYHLDEALATHLFDDPEAWLMLGEISLTYEAAGIDRVGRAGTEHYLTKAREVAEAQIEADPGNDDLKFLLARVAEASGDIAAADHRLRTLREPTLIHRATAARIGWRLGRTADALRDLEALRGEARTPAEHIVVADTFRAIGDEARARSVDLAALDRFPEDPWLVGREVRRLLTAGEAEAATDLAEEGVARHPESDSLAVALANALAAGTNGRERALTRLERFDAGPNHEVTLRRADLLLDTPGGDPRYPSRVSRAEALIRLGPEEPDLFPVYRRFLRGKVALRRGRPADAVAEFAEVTRRIPTDVAARRLLATAHFLLREYELQARELDSIVRLVGPHPELLLERAEAWLNAGILQNARRNILEVRSAAPGRPETALLLARLRIAEDDGQLVRGIETLEAAAKTIADPAPVLIELGLLRARLNDLDGAERDLLAARAAARTPERRLEVTDALSRVQAARDGSLTSSGSRRYWEEFFAVHPDSVDGLLVYAVRLLEAGEAARARRWIEKALRQDPDHAYALRWKFDAHAFEGASIDELVALAARVREAAPESVHDEYVHGRLSLLRNAPADAVRLLSAAARRAPNDPHIAFHLALAHVEVRDLAEAALALNRALDLEPRLSSARRLLADVHLDWAALLIEEGRPSTAAELLGRSLEHDPGNLHLRALRAKALYHAGFRENPSLLARARTYCEELLADLEARGEDAPAGFREPTLQLYGAVLMAQHDWAAAESAFQRHLTLRPDDAQSLHAVGVCRLRTGRAEDAVPPLRKALTVDPDQLSRLMVLLDALSAAGREKEAAELISRRIASRPDDLGTHSILGRFLFRSGQAREAEEVLRMTLRRDADQLPALDTLIELLIAERRVPEAIAAARDVRKRTTLETDVGVLLGHALLYTDPTHPESERLLREALTAGTSRADLWLRALHLCAGILLKTDRHAEARKLEVLYSDWTRQRREPLSDRPLADLATEAWFRLGWAADVAGKFARAEGCYRRALTLTPDHGHALNNLADLIGRSASSLAEPRRTDRLTDALALARRATEVLPGQPHPWDTHGATLLRLGKPADAVVSLTRALQIAEAPADQDAKLVAAVLVNLARAHLDLETPGPAKRALDRALTLDPQLSDQAVVRRLRARLR